MKGRGGISSRRPNLSDINWLEVAAGFSLGLTPLILRQTYILVRYSRLPGRAKYLGSWWSYHRSTTGSDTIYERRLKITYSLFLGRLQIRANSAEDDHSINSRLVYSGHISGRQGMVRYVALEDVASHERLSWYLFDPFFQVVDQTVGLYLALDLRGIPAAGPLLLSRERLSPEDVGRRLHLPVLRLADLLDDSSARDDTPAAAVTEGSLSRAVDSNRDGIKPGQ